MWGEFEPAYEEREGLIAYYRSADRRLLILANLKSEPEHIDIGCEYTVLLDNMNLLNTYNQRKIELQAWQGVILEIKTPPKQ